MGHYYSPPQPVNPTQQLCNATYKHLPNNQTIILKKEVTKVNLIDGTRTTETHEYPEPYHCANPYGRHKYVLVRDGDNGRVDKEKGIALCFDCLRVRYPHHFSRVPQLSRFSTPKSDPLKLDALDFGIPEEELPLPPLEPEEPPTTGWIVPYSLEEEWKLNPPKNLVVEQMPERHPVENDRSPIVMSEEDMKRMKEDIEAKIKSGEMPSTEQIDRDLKSGKIRYAN